MAYEPSADEIEAFREAWEAADARGEAGSRVRAGLIAANAERPPLSWGDMMRHIDEWYPEDVFPVKPDRDDRDTGPRLLSMLRRIDRLKKAGGPDQ